MKRIFKTIGAMSLLCSAAITTQAAPADGIARQWPQPDGSYVTLSLIGDEAFNCYITADGYVAERLNDGFFYFVGNDGNVTSSRVSNGVPANIDKQNSFTSYRNAKTNLAFLEARNAMTTRAAARIDKLGNSKWDNTDGHDLREVPTDGNLRVLVILVNFADKYMSLSDNPKQLFSDLLNKEGFDQYSSTGSAYDYFRDVSTNQFHPQFDVYGPVTLDKNCKEYISTTETYKNEDGKEVTVYAPGKMIAEACQKLDDEIDFTNYDANKDGIVDFVYVFHAGKGSTTGGSNENDIWPHAFTLTSALGAPIELDGVKVNRYATSCEIGRDPRELAGVGMFCHEFSHVLGLPDLYDTAHNGSAKAAFSVGTFSNMDAGNYNNNLHTPPMFSAYEQYALEWMLPVTITGSGDFTLIPLSARPNAYKLPTSNPCEYFLFEARAPYSWDEYLEGFGMLAWHIDYQPRRWENNTVNTSTTHQCIDIMEADDNLTSESRAGDTFPGSEGIHEIYASSSPALADWNLKGIGLEATCIQSHPDGTVTFTIEAAKKMDGIDLDKCQPKVYDVTQNSVSVYWPEVKDAEGYLVSVYEIDSFDGNYYRTYADGWYFRNVNKKNNVCVEDLKPGVNYGVMVYAYNDLANSRMDSHIPFFTQNTDFAKARPGIYAYSAADGGVEISWDAVADADSYQLTVATRKPGETARSVQLGFDEASVPEGWSANGKYENRDKYVGKAAPALGLTGNSSFLKSPVFENDIKNISFHQILNYAEENVALEVYGYNEDGSLTFLGKIDGLSNKGQDLTFDFPTGYRQVMIRLDARVTGLISYLDDFTVNLTAGHVDTPISGYDARKVEDTKLVVTCLEPNTEYVAYVKPFKGVEAGILSHAVNFIPAKVSQSVDILPADSDLIEADVNIYNGVVTANGAQMTVYTADGKIVARGTSCNLPSRGLYIVRVGNAAKKVCW
ncbi:MAG: M6 family metalloprotease domain-containing protein [Prevotella sp.]|nr:M6 family metalloprotease domain-containing protein [Bacteroides sp.]MCM1367077.1 M6 family metalloprotease domain-containing protein [Prevotella sp.]MCM1437541.1 M6 family metalloprotease domain-containing protein [Prevotella sp.]